MPLIKVIFKKGTGRFEKDEVVTLLEDYGLSPGTDAAGNFVFSVENSFLNSKGKVRQSFLDLLEDMPEVESVLVTEEENNPEEVIVVSRAAS